MFELQTEQLIIRDMTLDDETAFVDLSQDQKYQRFYSEPDCEADKYRQLCKLFVEQSKEQPRQSYQLAIEHKFSGDFIGTVCLRLEPDRQASIGCGLARAYQGNGLIHEAAKALICFGFDKLGVHRVYAETISENKAALRLCKSLGLQQEAHFREHRYFKGQWWDTIVLALRQSEWSQFQVDQNCTNPSLKTPV
ncbi:N-acetyltransferase [Alginatibacterium sediminis]|uniref:N-acetyltransferase n=1 Tax=Alginatibacterium sediminis TaxID=2164068 RepID=A0A420EI05_9ALTE|nr:GNAT family protein [Alginatibacterium sediminis]RKF20287.1 N-acetyltransferase [Alginatibacterium sediminis]